MAPPHNSQLYSALLAHYLEVVARLRIVIAEGYALRIRYYLHAHHAGPNEATATHEPYVDWEGVLLEHAHTIVALPRYASAISALASDPAARPHFDRLVVLRIGGRRVEEVETLRTFMASVLESQVTEPQGSPEPNVEAFASAYGQLESYFHATTVRVRAIAPLYGFWTDSPHIDLGSGLSITAISEAEQRRLFSEGTTTLRGPFGRILPAAAIEQIWDDPKRLLDPGEPVDRWQFEPPTELFDRLVSALRLFQSGGVAFLEVTVGPKDWAPFGIAFSFGRTASGPRVNPPYLLEGDQVPAFQSFWMTFSDRHHTLRRPAAALHRFNLGCERVAIEDRIVDYAIAIEALLLDGHSELSWRLQLRGAALLGADGKERLAVRDRLKLLYDVRSKIVHGTPAAEAMKAIAKSMDVGQFVAMIETDLRQCYARFLALAKVHGEMGVLDELDRRVVTGEFARPED